MLFPKKNLITVDDEKLIKRRVIGVDKDKTGTYSFSFLHT